MPNDDLFNPISNDYLDSFCSILNSLPNFQLDQNVTFQYDTHCNIINLAGPFFYLIDICALFGSTKCFKYIFMNLESIPNQAASYAIKGGSFEIVQILNQKGIDFSGCLNESILYHQYELTDWILLNYEPELIPISRCLVYYNFKAFLFYSNSQSLTKIIFETSYISGPYNVLHSACYIGHLPLVKYFIEKCE